jgi:hypothetical protein
VDEVVQEPNKEHMRARYKNNINWKIVVASICLFLVIISGLIAATPLYGKTIVRAGSIEGINVGIYWDSACKNTADHIEWGTMAIGSSKNQIVYIRNEGSKEAYLSMSTSDWMPHQATKYILFSWNYSGQSIPIGQIIPIQMSLEVKDNIRDTLEFDFNIQIITDYGSY